jgi:hypothetical protein
MEFGTVFPHPYTIGILNPLIEFHEDQEDIEDKAFGGFFASKPSTVGVGQ